MPCCISLLEIWTKMSLFLVELSSCLHTRSSDQTWISARTSRSLQFRPVSDTVTTWNCSESDVSLRIRWESVGNRMGSETGIFWICQVDRLTYLILSTSLPCLYPRHNHCCCRLKIKTKLFFFSTQTCTWDCITYHHRFQWRPRFLRQLPVAWTATSLLQFPHHTSSSASRWFHFPVPGPAEWLLPHQRTSCTSPGPPHRRLPPREHFWQSCSRTSSSCIWCDIVSSCGPPQISFASGEPSLGRWIYFSRCISGTGEYVGQPKRTKALAPRRPSSDDLLLRSHSQNRGEHGGGDSSYLHVDAHFCYHGFSRKTAACIGCINQLINKWKHHFVRLTFTFLYWDRDGARVDAPMIIHVFCLFIPALLWPSI